MPAGWLQHGCLLRCPVNDAMTCTCVPDPATQEWLQRHDAFWKFPAFAPGKLAQCRGATLMCMLCDVPQAPVAMSRNCFLGAVTASSSKLDERAARMTFRIWMTT